MRSPKIILENLQKHSKEENYKYERLYRNLYNEDFYLQALQNIYANKGAMTPGIDGLTLDGYGTGKYLRPDILQLFPRLQTGQELPYGAFAVTAELYWCEMVCGGRYKIVF